MFFILSKTISFLVKPIGILFILALLSVFLKNRTKKKRITVAFLVILYIFSCPAIIDPLIRTYEFPTQTVSEVKNYTFGVVLTGGLINESKSNDSSIYLGSQGDRLWQAAELYNTKKIKKIIISGGDGFERTEAFFATENDKSRDFLIKIGVKKEDIIQEKMAVNTFENAKFTKQLIANNQNPVLVITSAFHLKRALACFRNQNIKADGFATTPISTNYPFKWQDFIPTANTFKDSDLIANEIIGLVVYKLLGYI